MIDWVEELQRLRCDGKPAVLVTVASVKGSAPREPGAKMIVTAAGLCGTIGGGHLEHKAIGIARDQLAAGAAGGELRRFPLGASLGQCCGGLVNLLFEPIDRDAAWLDALAALRRRGHDAVVVTMANAPAGAGKLVVTREDTIGSLDSALDVRARELARTLFAEGAAPRLVAIEEGELHGTLYLEPTRASEFTIVLFGAGHVGRAIVRTLADFPCRITWVDERAYEFPRDVPGNVTVACTDIPEAEVDAAPADAYFLVMTHSHALDELLTERILRRADYAYFGLIGSLTKRRSFERRIGRRGLPAARFATMTCPIGVAGISSKEPAAIAIAVAAELLQARERRAAASVPEQAHRA
jgi:xanthine dehydrogenase accessory factor